MSDYTDLLKDPRWQKKRLEIFNRDGFECCKCYSKTNTLHVHHISYKKGCMPWEYEDKNFVTLCENCHYLITWLTKKHFIYSEINSIRRFDIPNDKILFLVWTENFKQVYFIVYDIGENEYGYVFGFNNREATDICGFIGLPDYFRGLEESYEGEQKASA